MTDSKVKRYRNLSFELLEDTVTLEKKIEELEKENYRIMVVNSELLEEQKSLRDQLREATRLLDGYTEPRQKRKYVKRRKRKFMKNYPGNSAIKERMVEVVLSRQPINQAAMIEIVQDELRDAEGLAPGQSTCNRLSQELRDEKLLRDIDQGMRVMLVVYEHS